MEFINSLRRDLESGNVNGVLQKIIAILTSIATIIGLIVGIATSVGGSTNSPGNTHVPGVVSTGAKYLKDHPLTDFGGMQYFKTIPMGGKPYEYSLTDKSTHYEEIYTDFRLSGKYSHLEATLGMNDNASTPNTYTDFIFIVDGTETMRKRVSSDDIVKISVPLIVDGSKGQSLRIMLRSFRADSNEADATITGATVGTPTLYP
ncbi:MAG: hypothetical protein SPK00_08980 [Corynebacterium glucuronolyticum]|nr:hypothetical protein [Mycobacteriaceae bacterium]MDY5834862.1 hypothetical protein [Corynebacterium glucuronolyticum]